MKRKYGNFLQLSREIFNNEKYKELSKDACWLFVVLNELEHKYTGKKEDFFFRSNQELAIDSRMKLTSMKKAKKELEECKLIQTWQMNWIDTKTKKKSEKHVTAYRIL